MWSFRVHGSRRRLLEQSDEPALPEGNETLGIVKFIEEEVGDQTTLRGLDADGNEVARLDLVHGRFTVTPPFTDEYDTPEVDGRKLNVHALGQKLYWETAGFEPVLHMPAHPPTQWALAAFLDDPHAKRILDQWQIGFEPFHGVGDGEVAYTSGNFRGDSPQNCDGLTHLRNRVLWNDQHVWWRRCRDPSGSPDPANRYQLRPLHRADESRGPGRTVLPVHHGSAWACLGSPEKVCPTTNNINTSCGTRPGRRVQRRVPGYPIDASQTCSTATGSPVGTCGSSVYQLDWSYTATTYTYVKASNTGCRRLLRRLRSPSRPTATRSRSEPTRGGAAVSTSSSTRGGPGASKACITEHRQGGQFGDTVALSDDGNTLAVGAPYGEQQRDRHQRESEQHLGTRCRRGLRVHALGRTSGRSKRTSRHPTPGRTTASAAPSRLSSNGNTLAVGAQCEDSNATGINGNQSDNSATDSGAVYVFTRSGTTWSQQAYIKASNTGPAITFGGDTTTRRNLAFPTTATRSRSARYREDSDANGVNGNQTDNSATDAGAAYVFTRSGTIWSQQAYLKAAKLRRV